MDLENLKQIINKYKEKNLELNKWSTEEILIKILEKERWIDIFTILNLKSKKEKRRINELYMNTAYRIPNSIINSIIKEIKLNVGEEFKKNRTSEKILMILKNGEYSTINLSVKIGKTIYATRSALKRMRNKGLVKMRRDNNTIFWSIA